MRTLVPFDARQPKTRLADLLDREERIEFAHAMLQDVLDVIVAAGGEPEVLSTTPIDCVHDVTVDERSLSDAVNGVLDGRSLPIAIVMADLGLLTPSAFEKLLEPSADVVIAPGLGGGTNALVVRHPEFCVDYHGISVRDHYQRAQECDATVATVDSFRLAVDVDTVSDITEILIHGEGRAYEWLRETGIRLATEEARPDIVRE